MKVSSYFPAYSSFDPKVPVWCLTPEINGCIHRFFDTCPISPSGRYVALFQLPQEDRPPVPGEKGHVILVDLQEGSLRQVAETAAWGTQLGAQVQWGRSDHELYFNRVEQGSWKVHAVRLDPATGEETPMDGPVYMVSPDGQSLASPCLLRTELTQGGYGTVCPAEKIPINGHASAEDGLYLTETQSGTCRLLVSFKEIGEATGDLLGGDAYRNGAFYGFHVKWNRQGTRLMFVIRYRYNGSRGNRISDVITMDADGSNIQVALPSRLWKLGGHHPDWCPDGDHILMNLALQGKGLQLVRFAYDGSNLTALGNCPGSGHPTMHPDGLHVLTDAYVEEPVSFDDGTVPIRWIQTDMDTESTLVRIHSQPKSTNLHHILRVDPHPAWDADFKHVVFNGCVDGVRKVFLADMSAYSSSQSIQVTPRG